tara:strand:+ start:4680 stop:5453 length:774 start_codon:yes stop_codon:yes gene_type:complete
MRILSTFNDKIYSFSGKGMLETVNTFLPEANILIYEELEEQTPDFPCYKIKDVPEFANVFEANKEVISKAYGGLGVGFPDDIKLAKGSTWWNYRWFGWFRKVVMNYHAVCVSNFDDEFLIFVDSDIRFTKSFDDEFLRRVTNGKPISFFRGNRPAIDSGLVVVNNKSKKPMKFYKWFMEMFTDGSFRKLNRWDDGYVLTKLVERCPEKWFCDFAKNQNPIKHKNSNGQETGGQVIPLTAWGDYVEHDKGIHIRNKVL